MSTAQVWFEYGWTETEPGSPDDPWYYDAAGTYIKVTWRITTWSYEPGDPDPAYPDTYHLMEEGVYRINPEDFPPGDVGEPTTKEKFELFLNGEPPQVIHRWLEKEGLLPTASHVVPQGFTAGVSPGSITLMADETSAPELANVPDDYFGDDV